MRLLQILEDGQQELFNELVVHDVPQQVLLLYIHPVGETQTESNFRMPASNQVRGTQVCFWEKSTPSI